MTTRVQKIPGPDHPITISPSTEHVVVRSGDTVIADTHAPLVLQESTYPPVYYVPIADVDQGVLQPTDTSTYCPFKGDASYYTAAGVKDAIWYYPEPYEPVAEIKNHVAFYTDRVALTVES